MNNLKFFYRYKIRMSSPYDDETIENSKSKSSETIELENSDNESELHNEAEDVTSGIVAEVDVANNEADDTGIDTDDTDDDTDDLLGDIDNDDFGDLDLEEVDGSKKEKEISGLKHNENTNSNKIPIDNEFDFGADESTYISPPPSDIDDEDDNYLQKFDSELRNKFINEYHPEVNTNNYAEIEALTNKPHKTIPFLTKYEKTKILGLRAKQINQGSQPYIELKNKIIEGYLIAELELRAKKIPFIVRRPLPDNSSEYWKLEDLELI